MIRKLKSGEYRLYSKKTDPQTGKRHNLGTFSSRAAAEKHGRTFSISSVVDRPQNSSPDVFPVILRILVCSLDACALRRDHRRISLSQIEVSYGCPEPPEEP
jgi:hypothetical protein